MRFDERHRRVGHQNFAGCPLLPLRQAASPVDAQRKRGARPVQRRCCMGRLSRIRRTTARREQKSIKCRTRYGSVPPDVVEGGVSIDCDCKASSSSVAQSKHSMRSFAMMCAKSEPCDAQPESVGLEGQSVTNLLCEQSQPRQAHAAVPAALRPQTPDGLARQPVGVVHRPKAPLDGALIRERGMLRSHVEKLCRGEGHGLSHRSNRVRKQCRS